jgi:hypothetical protein
MLASGNVDPGVMSNLMNVFGDDQEAIQKIVDISLNLGSADAGRAFALANLFEDEAMKKDFIARIETKTPQQAIKTLEMFEVIQQAGGVLDMQVVLDAYMKDEAAGDKLVEDIEEFRAAQEAGPITVDIINRVFNAEAADAVAADIEYFNSLDKDMQVVYLTTLQTAFETIEANPGDYQIWAAAQGNKPNSEMDYSIFKANQASDAAMRARTLQSDMEDDTPSGGSSGPTASSLDDVLKKLRDIRKNQVGVTKGFEASANAINKLFGGGAGINLFSGIENDMRRLGAEEDLISLIAGMDPEEFEKKKNTLFNFDRQTGEIIGFKEQLQNIGRALSAVALGQYVSDQQRSAKESRNQVLAFNQLRAAGYSVAEAYETVQDAAVASAVATGNVTRDQLGTMLQELRNAESAMKQAARLTPEGLQEVFEEGFSKAMEAFDAQERKLTLEYELKIADDQKLIEDAQNQIDAIRYQIDDYEADLKGIEDQEEAINKTYDEKLEALEKVRKANQKVLDQEKGKLSVAEAITRGDLAAAARAVQDVRATSASGYFSSQTDALNAGRQSALDAVRGENKLSRIEIEERLEQLANQIFEIEENTLEPATERVRLAGIELQSRIDELEVLGKTRTEWETIKNNIDVARVNSQGYKEAMAEALDVVQNVLDAWNGIQSKEVVLTTIQRTVVEGTATGPNYTGPQGPADPEPLTEEEQKAEEYTRLSSQLSGLKSSLQNYENQLKPLVERRNGLKTVMDMERGPNETSKHWPEYQSLQTKINDLITARNWTGKAIQDVEKQLKAVAPAKAPGALSWKAVATGGYIAGPGTATSDSIPAMLSNGEYVIKAATVKKFGTKMFDSINSGSLPILSGANSMSAPRFASVGSTVSVSQASVPSRQAAASSSNSVYNYSLSVNVASQSDPNTIAQTVMNQLRMVDSQRIRGNRF